MVKTLRVDTSRPYDIKIGSGLLARAAEASRTGAVKVINTESRCPSIAGFLAARNIPRAGRQFEMVRKL